MQTNPLAPAAPGIDIGNLAGAIGTAIQNVLTNWSNGLPDRAATEGSAQLRTFWSWFNVQGVNFFARTPLDVVTAAGTNLGVNNVRPLLEAVVTIAILLGAVALAGHHWLGWPGLEETASRVLITVILTGMSFRLLIFSIDILNKMVAGVTTAFPPLPSIDAGGNAVLAFGLLVIWIVLALRLALVMGKRLIWLSVLYVFAPLAIACWVHQKSAWITSTWAKLWVGWLVGQLVVVVVMVVGVTMAGFGGPGGYLLSVAALLVAWDAVHILAPSQSGLALSLGVGPIRVRF